MTKTKCAAKPTQSGCSTLMPRHNSKSRDAVRDVLLGGSINMYYKYLKLGHLVELK